VCLALVGWRKTAKPRFRKLKRGFLYVLAISHLTGIAFNRNHDILHTVQQHIALKGDSAMSQRAFYSVDDVVLAEFNRLVPARKRSRVITELMAQHVSNNETALEKAARLIEADAGYKEVNEDTALISFENLVRFGHDE
jgi:hypothetical protein